MRKAIYMILVGLFLAGCGQGAQTDTKADAVQQEQSGREQESGQKDSAGGEKEQDPSGESSLTVSKEDSKETISGTEGMEESAAGQGTDEEGLKKEGNDIRKLIASAEMFEDYESQRETLEKLYELRNVPKNPVNPEGTWNRTNVRSGDWGTLTVSQVKDESFFVEGELGYYCHSGVFRQNAYYVTDNLAIAKDREVEGLEPQYVAFFLQEDSIKVMASYGSWGLGFGANVVIDGEYIQGEPVYTNANVLEELFTEKDLDALEKLLSEGYFTDDFLFATKGGIVESEETLLDGREVTWVHAYVPTMGGYGYTLYFSSDEGYYSITFDKEENFSTEGKQ